MSRKELKILDIFTLYFVSSFRRNYNNRLLKLAHQMEARVYLLRPGEPQDKNDQASLSLFG